MFLIQRNKDIEKLKREQKSVLLTKTLNTLHKKHNILKRKQQRIVKAQHAIEQGRLKLQILAETDNQMKRATYGMCLNVVQVGCTEVQNAIKELAKGVNTVETQFSKILKNRKTVYICPISWIFQQNIENIAQTSTDVLTCAEGLNRDATKILTTLKGYFDLVSAAK